MKNLRVLTAFNSIIADPRFFSYLSLYNIETTAANSGHFLLSVLFMLTPYCHKPRKILHCLAASFQQIKYYNILIISVFCRGLLYLIRTPDGHERYDISGRISIGEPRASISRVSSAVHILSITYCSR